MSGTSCLLVVDVQHDFLPGGALGVKGGDDIVTVVNQYILRFTEAGLAIIFTRDWHPARTKHFNTDGGPWPPHCVQDTAGAAFASRLRVPPFAIVVSKGMDPNEDSYSAFDARGPNQERLDSLLRERGVSRLYIAGLATDYCVLYSAHDARRLGYEVIVLEDAVRGVDDNASQAALGAIAREGGKLITLAQLPTRLE